MFSQTFPPASHLHLSTDPNQWGSLQGKYEKHLDENTQDHWLHWPQTNFGFVAIPERKSVHVLAKQLLWNSQSWGCNSPWREQWLLGRQTGSPTGFLFQSSITPASAARCSGQWKAHHLKRKMPSGINMCKNRKQKRQWTMPQAGSPILTSIRSVEYFQKCFPNGISQGTWCFYSHPPV